MIWQNFFFKSSFRNGEFLNTWQYYETTMLNKLKSIKEKKEQKKVKEPQEIPVQQPTSEKAPSTVYYDMDSMSACEW